MKLQDLKSRLSIVSVLSHYGLSMDRNGMLLCPFHDDSKASLQIYEKGDRYCCFSSNCAAGSGDQLDFIALMERKVSGGLLVLDKESRHKGIMKAKSMLGEVLVSSNVKVGGVSKSSVKSSSSENVDYGLLYSRMLKGYQSSSKAKSYASSRGLSGGNLVLGYNSGSYYAHLRGCLVFGLKDKEGQIVSLYGRSISSSSKGEHYYLKGRRGLYPGYPLSLIHI